MNPSTKARSPGKLILSGEHSVVYGKPALAMATHYYTESTAAVNAALARQVVFRLPNLRYAKQLTRTTLNRLTARVKKDYHAFLAGECSIRDVLKKPFELIQFTVANVLDLSQAMIQNLDIRSYSTIPMGCGMGSSAALVMSTLHAVAEVCGLDLEPQDYLRLGVEAENCQHGYSSGLDLHLAWHGGCVSFQEGVAVPYALPKTTLYWVNTGQPQSTTGECVVQARAHFLNSRIADDFEAVTSALGRALGANKSAEAKMAVRSNHRLLQTLGVVPEKVASFIQAVELHGGAAKVCGAGAVAGDGAGVVLVLGEDVEKMQNVAVQYGYTLQPVIGEAHGTRIV